MWIAVPIAQRRAPPSANSINGVAAGAFAREAVGSLPSGLRRRTSQHSRPGKPSRLSQTRSATT